MNQMTQFTAAEAAFVLREPVRAVKKALDTGPVRPVLRRKAGTPIRTIGWADLFYLFAVKALRDELTPKARAEFYEALQQGGLALDGEVRIGRIRIAVADLVREVDERTTELSQLAGKVTFRDDGEAVLKGSDIEVHRIAALLDGGLSVADVQSDYPSLDRDAVEAARAYAGVHPKPGRPYPKTTAKRALRGAGLEALDEVIGDGVE